MENYQKAIVKLTNTQLNKLKSARQNKAGTILRLNKKNNEVRELPHELFLTTRQPTKIKNTFANNMSTDIKPSKALNSIAIPLARDNFPGLVRNLTSSAINNLTRK